MQVSTGGGQEPTWSPDGRELFYRNGDRMMSVSVATQPAIQAASPVELWRHTYWSSAFPVWNYDVGHDGRFLMLQPTTDAAGSGRTTHVVLNWLDDLKPSVPKN
jgi:hypothetical protein